MTSKPLVSVIIPAYNAEAFIQDTLKSILAQTYQNFEIIVVDDGSCDRTAELVQSFGQRDDRIKLFQQSNSGTSVARNLAIQYSVGKYIAPIDADDIWFPQRLEKHVHRLENADSTIGLVYSWSAYLTETGAIKGYSPFGQLGAVEGNVLAALVFYNFLDNASTTMFRRDCLDRVGLYNPELKTCEDWDLYLRIAEHYHFCIVPEYLIGYRQYSGSASTNCAAMANFYELIMSRIYQRHPELPEFLQFWANTVFYNNLLGKSYLAGDYPNMFRWLYRSLRRDFALLLRPGIYKATLVGCLKLLTQSHKTLHQQIQPTSKFAKATPIELPQLSPPSKMIAWKPYDRLISQRWQQMVKTTQV